MNDRVVWKPVAMDTQEHGRRTVYIRHVAVPFVGLLVDADTAFTVPAFIRCKGRRIRGFVTPRDGMAFQQEHGAAWFVAFKAKEV